MDKLFSTDNKSRLSWEQKLLALKALGTGASVDLVNGSWKVNLGYRVKTMSREEEMEQRLTGDSPEDAVNNAWFWITGEDDGRGTRWVGPAEREKVMIDLRNGYELWVRWNGFMWGYSVIQKGHKIYDVGPDAPMRDWSEKPLGQEGEKTV